MGLQLDIRSRPLAPGHSTSATGTLEAAGVGAAAGTAISGVFHHSGPPKLAIGGKPWNTATLGVGLMVGLSTAALYATNHGALHHGKRTNSMLESTLLSAAVFAVPGLLIHGKMDFSGKPVNRFAAAAGVALIGAAFGPFIHQATIPG